MKILFFGDSITDMARSRDMDGQAFGYGVGYVNGVASALKYENPEKYEIINRGISGNRVVDLYARIKADVWNHKPDLISILIGVNDVWHRHHNSLRIATTDEQTKLNYTCILERIKRLLRSRQVRLTDVEMVDLHSPGLRLIGKRGKLSYR